MTLHDLCAVVYVLRLEELQSQVSTQILAATLARSMGSEVEVPDWYEARAEFDAMLVARPARTNPDDLVLDRALGLRR